MPRKITVVTTCSCGMQGMGRQALDKFSEMLDDFIAIKPDLVCLPEGFADYDDGVSPDLKVDTEEVFGLLCKKARGMGTYLVAGMYELIDSKKYNVAWVIDRKGKLVGRYLKIHPVYRSEIVTKGVTPGCDVPVFDLDFGRIGIAICFDIGWPDLWQTLHNKGAELVVWPSAYGGGFPLQAYAWSYFYYVVSSVRGYHSRIIDKTGRVLKSTSAWQNFTYGVIDMEKEIFHIDGQFMKLNALQRELGRKVTIESLTEENIFTIESNDSEYPVSRIKKEFGLKTFREYLGQEDEIHSKYRP